MTIIIYGDKKDNILSKALLRILPKYGGIRLHYADKIISVSELSMPKFLVYDVHKMPKFMGDKGILIFKNSFNYLLREDLPENFLPVFDMQNLKAIRTLKDTNKIVLTCGISSKNTLNFASFSSTDAVISLQRYITTMNNKKIEPHDFTVKLTEPMDANTLLFVCTVLLLSDIPSMEGYEF